MQGKLFIDTLHLTECRNNIPSKPTTNLRIHQHVFECMAQTYQKILKELLEAMCIPLNERANELLRTLDELDITTLTQPKISAADYTPEELKKQIDIQGKYIYLCIKQSRWNYVLTCADEVLLLAPNDTNFLNIKKQAMEHLALNQTNHQTNNTIQSGNTTSSSRTEKKDTSFFKTSASSKPIDSGRTSQNRTTFSPKSIRRKTLSSITRNAFQPKSSKATSQSNDIFSSNKVTYSKRPKSNNLSDIPIEKYKQNYLINYAHFISDLAPINKTIFRTICLFDLVIPFILSLLLPSYYFSITIISFVLSLLALIIGPITQNRRIATFSIAVFSISWTFLGLLVGFGILKYMEFFHLILTKSIFQLNYITFPIALSILFLLIGFSIHINIVFCTNHLVKVKSSA